MDGEFRVKMADDLNIIAPDFTDTIKGRVATLEAEHLFTVREVVNSKLLDRDWATAFYHSVAQLLFDTPCVKKDIHTDVVLLNTRVRIPDEDDWRKL